MERLRGKLVVAEELQGVFGIIGISVRDDGCEGEIGSQDVVPRRRLYFCPLGVVRNSVKAMVVIVPSASFISLESVVLAAV